MSGFDFALDDEAMTPAIGFVAAWAMFFLGAYVGAYLERENH